MKKSRFDTHSRGVRPWPWSGGGALLALFAVSCSGSAVEGSGSGSTAGGRSAGGGGAWGYFSGGGTWGSGGLAVGGSWAGGGQYVQGGAPGEDSPAGGTGGREVGTGGTGGVVVYDRDGCERRQSECFAAVDALCAVLDSYDCDHLVQECSSAHDACLRSWVVTCPRGVGECYSRAELCYSSGLPNDVCDEIFFGCGEEARLCHDAISSEESEPQEEEIELLGEPSE